MPSTNCLGTFASWSKLSITINKLKLSKIVEKIAKDKKESQQMKEKKVYLFENEMTKCDWVPVRGYQGIEFVLFGIVEKSAFSNQHPSIDFLICI